jgi:hypothetical protein
MELEPLDEVKETLDAWKKKKHKKKEKEEEEKEKDE